VLSLSGLILFALQQVSFYPECFIRPPQHSNSPAAKLRGHTLVSCGHFIIQSTKKSLPLSAALFQIEKMASYVWRSNKTGIIRQSCPPSPSPTTFLSQPSVAVGCSNEWIQIAELTKGATSHSQLTFSIIFTLDGFVGSWLKCWHFLFKGHLLPSAWCSAPICWG